MSGAASNVRDLEYDEADDETYEDYAYDYEDYSSLSPPAEPYFSPYNPYSRQQGQQGKSNLAKANISKHFIFPSMIITYRYYQYAYFHILEI